MLAPTARLTARGAPFEILEAEIDGIPCRVYRHAPKTLADLYRKAERYAQREFIACGQRRLTYGTILERARVVAGALSAGIDVRDGARVALIGRNRPEWVIGFIAITLVGATAVVIHHAATTEQIIEALDVAEQPVLAWLSERDRHAIAAGSAGPANAMHVRLGRRWDIIVHDM